MVSIFQNKDKYIPNTKDKTNLLILDLAQLNRVTLKKIYYYSDLIIKIDKQLIKGIVTNDNGEVDTYKNEVRKILTPLKNHNKKIENLLKKINDNQRKNTNLGKNSLMKDQGESSIHNVALGIDSMKSINNSTGNIAIGSYSMSRSTEANNNVVIGNCTVDGDGNTIIGKDNHSSTLGESKLKLKGNNNTFIGGRIIDDNNFDSTNQIIIGSGRVTNRKDNTVRFNFENIFTKNLGHTNRRFKEVFTQSISKDNEGTFTLPASKGTEGDYVLSSGSFQSKSRDGMSRSHAGWNPNNNQDLGTSRKQFKNLYLSQGIKIKNQNIIEYPFITINKDTNRERDLSVGVKFNNLKVFSSGGKSVSLDKDKNSNNVNITSTDIINSRGRLYLPNNYSGNITFTQTAAKMISDLKLTNNGDYIENLLISARSTRDNYNGYDIDIANKLKANNRAQYIFSKGFNSDTIKTDMSMRMRIKRINPNKIHIKFIAF